MYAMRPQRRPDVALPLYEHCGMLAPRRAPTRSRNGAMDQCEPEWHTPGQCSVEASGHGFPAEVVIKRGVACGIGSFIFYSGQQNPSRFFSSSLASASSYACMQIR